MRKEDADLTTKNRNDNAYEEYLTTMLDPEEALKQIEQWYGELYETNNRILTASSDG